MRCATVPCPARAAAPAFLAVGGPAVAARACRPTVRGEPADSDALVPPDILGLARLASASGAAVTRVRAHAGL